jgi:RNA polymerase-binding transcription factor DksA
MSLNLETQKKNLLTEKEMLLRQLSGLGLIQTQTDEFIPTHEKPNEPIIDDNERADLFEEFETNASTGEILQERLVDVVDALQKIENNTYGICEKMGVPIEEDRLIANPAARTCKAAMNS